MAPDRAGLAECRFRKTAGQAGCHLLPRTASDGGQSPANAVWVYRPSGVQIPEPPPLPPALPQPQSACGGPRLGPYCVGSRLLTSQSASVAAIAGFVRERPGQPPTR